MVTVNLPMDARKSGCYSTNIYTNSDSHSEQRPGQGPQAGGSHTPVPAWGCTLGSAFTGAQDCRASDHCVLDSAVTLVLAEGTGPLSFTADFRGMKVRGPSFLPSQGRPSGFLPGWDDQEARGSMEKAGQLSPLSLVLLPSWARDRPSRHRDDAHP